MTQAANNLRVRRTRKLLRDALIELIEEQGFDVITVGEITERAMISRASFYRNYKDKYDLVEQIFEEAIQALTDFVSKPDAEHPTLWVRFFEHVEEYEPLYKALLGRNGSPWFVLKMRTALLTMMREFEQLYHQNPQVYHPVFHSNAGGVGLSAAGAGRPAAGTEHPAAGTERPTAQAGSPVAAAGHATGRTGILAGDPYVEDLVASMLVETITWWLEQGKPCSARQIADRCSSLIGAVFRETSTWEETIC